MGAMGGANQLSKRVDHLLSNFFYSAGWAVAGRPFHFIVGCVLFSVILGCGSLLLEMENDWFALYAPDVDNQAREDLSVNKKYFPINDVNEQSLSWIITSKKDSGNLLNDADVFTRVKALDSEILSLEFEGGLKLQDICKKTPGFNSCDFKGISDMISGAGQIPTLTSPFFSDPSGFMWPTWVFFGGVTVASGDAELHEITDVKAFRMFVPLDPTHPSGFDAIKRWEREFLKFMKTKSEELIDEGELAPFQLTYEATVSGNDELNNSIRPDWRLFVGLGITVTFVAHMILRSFRNFTLSKGMVVQPALLAVVLACACSAGLLGYVGVKFNLVHISALVLLFGLGLDDAFLIVQAYHQSAAKLTPQATVQERLALSLSSSGVSILFTSLTDCLVFAIGISSPFPAVRDFCIFASLGVFFTFAFQIIFFGAALAIDIHREYTNTDEIRGVLGFGWAPGFGKTYDPNRKLADAEVHTEEIPLMPEVAFMNKSLQNFGELLLMPSVSILVAVIVIAYWIFIGFGLWQLDSGLTLSDLTTTDSYWSDFQNNRMKYFNEKGFLFTLTVPPGAIDYSNPTERDAYMDLISKLEALECLEPEPLGVWLIEFNKFTTSQGLSLSSMHGNEFNQGLKGWLQGPGIPYSDDVMFDSPDASDVGATRAGIRMEALGSDSGDTNGVPCMNAARETIEAWHSGRPGKIPVVTNQFFEFWESSAIVVEQATLNLVFAFIGCFIITLFVLPHSIQLFVILLATASILGGVFASLPLVWNEKVSVTSLICLVISVGFAIDNVVHISHSYMASRFTGRREKLLDALQNVGMPIFAGNSTTVIGLLWLMLYSSKIFGLFMKVVCTVLLLGSLHAMVFLPVLLGNLGPEPLVSEMPEEESHQKKPSERQNRVRGNDLEAGDGEGGGNRAEIVQIRVGSDSFVKGHDEPVYPPSDIVQSTEIPAA